MLLDIRLPDVEGVELIAPLQEIHPDIVVIMATAYASVETAVRAVPARVPFQAGAGAVVHDVVIKNRS